MYRVEFSDPVHAEGALQRRFSEETAQAIGSLIFRNGQSSPFVVETVFEDARIPMHSAEFENRLSAIEAIYDGPQAEELVKQALDSAFASDYDKLAERTDIGIGIDYAIRSPFTGTI